jgi:ParB-like chromosome segregation protein Spo0J
MNRISTDLAHLVRPLASLTLHPRNARRHDERNLKAVADSLATYGQQKPIVVANDGVVVAGNGTLQAALRLGWRDYALGVVLPGGHDV